MNKHVWGETKDKAKYINTVVQCALACYCDEVNNDADLSADSDKGSGNEEPSGEGDA